MDYGYDDDVGGFGMGDWKGLMALEVVARQEGVLINDEF